jgi:hypothetical protein
MSYRSIILLVAATLNLVVQQGWLSPSILAPVDPNSVAIQNDGFRVVFVEASENRPIWLRDVFNSPALIAYLDSHCEGGKAGWRQWDSEVSVANAPAPLQELWAVPDVGVPSITVSKGKRAVSLPLEKQTDAEVLATLKRYGGE